MIPVESVLPLVEGFAESEWTLSEAVGAFNPSFGWRPAQVVRYANAGWLGTLRYKDLSQEHRHLLAKFVAEVGTHRPFWVSDPSHNKRGSLASSELLDGWELGSFWNVGTGRSAEAVSGGIRINRTTATDASTVGLQNNFATVNGAVYAFRAVFQFGAGATHGIILTAGSTRTGTGYGLGSVNAVGGRLVLKCLPTATTMFVGNQDTVTVSANWTQQGFYVIKDPSVVRAFTVDGGSGALSQTGSKLYVNNLPTGTSGLLHAGDMIEIISGGFNQMLRLTEDLNADSSGKGFIMFEPGVRAAVVNGDLIVPCRPQVKMRLTADPGIITRPGWYSDVVLECVEHF